MTTSYRHEKVEVSLEDIIGPMDSASYERFLDMLSRKHSGTELLMDIEMTEIQPLVIDVYGDTDEAQRCEEYQPEYGQETIWDMRRDEPEAFR
jgi:hypothetical protein